MEIETSMIKIWRHSGVIQKLNGKSKGPLNMNLYAFLKIAVFLYIQYVYDTTLETNSSLDRQYFLQFHRFSIIRLPPGKCELFFLIFNFPMRIFFLFFLLILIRIRYIFFHQFSFSFINFFCKFQSYWQNLFRIIWKNIHSKENS